MQSLVDLLEGHLAPQRGAKLKAGLRHVLQSAAKHLNWNDEAKQDAGCWPGQETLAAAVGCTVRTVRRHLDAAVRLNIIRSKRQGAGMSNRLFWNPGLLSAAREFGRLSHREKRTVMIYLNELPSWGDSIPAPESRGIAIKFIADKMTGESLIPHSPRGAPCFERVEPEAITLPRSSASGAPVGGARARAVAAANSNSIAMGPGRSGRQVYGNMLAARRQGVGGLAAASRSQRSALVVPVSRSKLYELDAGLEAGIVEKVREAGLDTFIDYLRAAGIRTLSTAMMRRRIGDRQRGGQHRRMEIAVEGEALRREVLWALRERAKNKSQQQEVYCYAKGLVLVDDVELERVQEYCMRTGYRALCLETSAGNYQALFLLGHGLSDDQHTAIARALMQHFRQFAKGNRKGADKNSARARQPHRLPGSVNYKDGDDGKPIEFVTRVAGIYGECAIKEPLVLLGECDLEEASCERISSALGAGVDGRDRSKEDWKFLWAKAHLPDERLVERLVARALHDAGTHRRTPKEARAYAERTVANFRAERKKRWQAPTH